MLYAIISDIHGNLEALREVLDACSALQVDRIVCLGDMVGYGAAPNECCTMVKAHVNTAVLGNHDAAVSGRMDYSYYYDLARRVLDLHRAQLSTENLRWLQSLPLLHRELDEGLAFSHGSPITPASFDYIFNMEQVNNLYALWDNLSPINFIGHSHLVKAFCLDPNRTRTCELKDECITCDPQYKYIFSVGSVGQPRDMDARACFCTYDTEKRQANFIRIDYPLDEAASKVLQIPFSAPFGKRLFLGT